MHYTSYRGIPPELEGVLKICREFAREHLCEIVVEIYKYFYMHLVGEGSPQISPK